jgi:hypothetical protein
VQKAPKIVTKSIICEGIRNGKKSALEIFTNGLLPESIATGVERPLNWFVLNRLSNDSQAF